MAPNICLITCSAAGVNTQESQRIQDLIQFIDPHGINWVTFNSLEDRPAIEEVIGRFGLKPSLAEEVINPGLWEVKEEEGACLFLRLAKVTRNPITGQLQEFRASFILGTQYLLLFHNGDGGSFAKTRRKLLEGRFNERQGGADDLLYLLLREWAVDNYYSSLKSFHGKIQQLEEELLNTQGEESTYAAILKVRREVGRLGDYLLACFEFVDALKTMEASYITPSAAHYFTQSLPEDMTGFWREHKSQRETLKELLEIYQTLITNKMNRGLQFLTAIVTIFLPVIFIAGMFSMNFRYMPDREWPWSYPLILIVIGLLFLTMVLLVKRRKMF
jgi:magnesium transporter